MQARLLPLPRYVLEIEGLDAAKGCQKAISTYETLDV